MLKEEVVQAVKDNKFHVYAVSTIDEGIEILTGVKAGELEEDGKFEEDSVHGLVQLRLEEMAKKSRKERSNKNNKDSPPVVKLSKL